MVAGFKNALLCKSANILSPKAKFLPRYWHQKGIFSRTHTHKNCDAAATFILKDSVLWQSWCEQ